MLVDALLAGSVSWLAAAEVTHLAWSTCRVVDNDDIVVAQRRRLYALSLSGELCSEIAKKERQLLEQMMCENDGNDYVTRNVRLESCNWYRVRSTTWREAPHGVAWTMQPDDDAVWS
jgi:hypothetical protein